VSMEHQVIQSLFEQLTTSQSYSFPLKGKSINAPKSRGIYIIKDANDNVVHVGNTPRAKLAFIKD